MTDDDRPQEGTELAGDVAALLERLGEKVDTVAGATAAVASTQNDLLARMAQAEARQTDDALEVAQRLHAIERQVLALAGSGGDGGPGSPDGASSGALAELTAAATAQREDLALALDVLARMAEALERSDARTEDRLAAVRDAAAVPVADLQALFTARADRNDAHLAELANAIGSLEVGTPASSAKPDAEPGEGAVRLSAAADRITARVDELSESVRALSWQLPEITDELAALRERVEGVDVTGPVTAASDELGERLSLHTDTALAGVLRLLDDRLNALRSSISTASGAQEGGGQGSMGFEAGAVMGAAQAAWNRLEQRLDTEFDDLSRQLQAMGAVIEQALATAEAAANRPVVTGDQLRRAASSVKETVLGASRFRDGTVVAAPAASAPAVHPERSVPSGSYLPLK